MATYFVHDAYYNNQHVYFWDGDAIVAVPKPPISGGRMFSRFFYTIVVIGLTWAVTNQSAAIHAIGTSLYNYWFPAQPVSPLAKTLLDLLTDPDNWTLDTRDQHLILKGSGVYNLNDNEPVVGEPYRIIFYINGDERSNLLSDAERKKVYLAIRVCKQTLQARENQAVADRLTAVRVQRRTSQCAFPGPARQTVTLPSPAAVGVALPPADAKEKVCDPSTEHLPEPVSAPSPRQSSSRWAAGQRR